MSSWKKKAYFDFRVHYIMYLLLPLVMKLFSVPGAYQLIVRETKASRKKKGNQQLIKNRILGIQSANSVQIDWVYVCLNVYPICLVSLSSWVQKLPLRK